MRLARALTALALLAPALLLMSALVVCDAPADMPAPADDAPVRVTLLPVALPAQEAGVRAGGGANAPREVIALTVCALCFAPLLPLCRDANGRVLSAARYENSFYQLFRPEVAGG